MTDTTADFPKDRRHPNPLDMGMKLASIVLLLIQLAGVIGTFFVLENRMTTAEKRIDEMVARLNSSDTQETEVLQRLARVEEKSIDQLQMLRDINFNLTHQNGHQR